MSILDDVVKGVNDGIKQVGDGINKIQSKSQEMMQSVGLQSRITALEAKKSVALSNIGKLIYDKYEKSDEVGEELLKRKVSEIVEIEREIDLIKTELNTIKVQYDPDVPRSQRSDAMAGYGTTPGFSCPHCHAPGNKEKLFCAYCGGSMTDAPSTEGAKEN